MQQLSLVSQPHGIFIKHIDRTPVSIASAHNHYYTITSEITMSSNDINPPIYSDSQPLGPNGPTGTGAQASGTRGGHSDNTGNASNRGGRQGGGGWGHHSGSKK
ncbi:hypothetical protein COL940_006137 [Colletotrichum noveboracense]|nr:hypothetical protein COL940_006137 [Colletotrichum noveboracense]